MLQIALRTPLPPSITNSRARSTTKPRSMRPRDRPRLQAAGVAPRAPPERDLPLRPLIQRVLLAEVAPVRQLQLASVDTACSRLRDADLAAPEHQFAHIVAVPVSPPVGLDLALGAAEQRAVRLESFPQLLQPSGEQEVAQGKPCVQDRPPKQQLAARGPLPG